LPSAAGARETAAATPSTSPVPESSASLDASARSGGSAPSGSTIQPNSLPESLHKPTAPDSAKAELNILPPENAKRPAMRWEAPAGGSTTDPATSQPSGPARRDDRPTYQPRDRRDSREGHGENRGPRVG